MVVCDGSPDGTGEIAETFAKSHDNLSVIHRRVKQGIGPAYVAGFKQALATETSFIFEMDCDFSHDPANIPAFLEAIRSADLVLGSRYVPGGRVENWGLTRRLISRWGGIYSRWVLGIPVNDLTGGNKCFRREVLEALDRDTVSSAGYGIQIEITTLAIKKGFRARGITKTI